ncbi:hypothetical protein [Vibrio sp.]|uniref:hypothetical protein n=1 Tax=Vibrio sp. TaxID=678 RepID=UPI003F6C2C96
MQSIIDQGVIGIIVGICTAAILFVLKAVWTYKVVPFLSSTRYQGVKIDGHWTGREGNDAPDKGLVFKNESSLFLQQSAQDLKGVYTFKFESVEKNFTLEFDVKGYIWEGYITLNFTPRDRRITSYATSLLKLHSGGSSLVGQWLFRDVEKEVVTSTPLYLTRQSE